METKLKTQPEKKSSFFIEALDNVIAAFIERSRDIIKSRFGIGNNEPMTLEEIGQKYSITRERVRQVIREVLKKVKDKKNEGLLEEVNRELIYAIEQNSGIIEEKKLLEMLSKRGADKGAIRFFLECNDDIAKIEEKGEIKKALAQKEFSISIWRKIRDAAKQILVSKKEPVVESELIREIAAKVKFDEKTILDYLEISEELKKNNFGKWGMAGWKEISPKGTREKAYLILKEAGNPLHFREIAAQIDKNNLNKKKTHPQTVHNELIKDKKFVLIGRGIYALSEWGYKKGTVKDVVEEILRKSTKPLSREEILKRVLKVRQVKKSTIVINLNNYFAKTKTGEYTFKK